VNLPNRLSVLRITLVPVFIALLLYWTPERDVCRLWAIGIYVFACLTDALDGFLARRLGAVTSLGSYIDPIADKLLLVSGYVALSMMPHLPDPMRIPGWLTLTVLSRDIIILGGAALIFMATGTFKAQPLFIGKLTTVAQMAALFVSLWSLPWEVRVPFYVFAGALTVLSGGAYVRKGGRLFQKEGV
jgi:cardiolipin synthase (CMP-forming)